MPDARALTRLTTRLRGVLSAATATLEALYPRGVGAWEDAVGDALAQYHLAAYVAGSGEQTPRPEARTAVQRDIAGQLAYLRRFGAEIQDGATWQRGWNARAASYADAIQVPYWRGATHMLPLPAMPGEGSQCLTHCHCQWDVQVVDADAGDYDATWVLGASEHCQTCTQRAADWAPLRIRDGRVA